MADLTTPPMPAVKSSGQQATHTEANQVRTAILAVYTALGTIDDGSEETLAERLAGLDDALAPQVVNFGTDAAFVRPDTLLPVVWVGTGTVQPANKQTQDVVVLPREEHLKDKTATTTRTSTTTLTDDQHMTVQVTAGKKYRVEVRLAATGSTSGDLEVGFTFPSGSTMMWMPALHGGTTTQTGSSQRQCRDISETVTMQTVGTAAADRVSGTIEGILTAGATGTFAVRWAQATSNATATSLHAGSYMSLLEIPQ